MANTSNVVDVASEAAMISSQRIVGSMWWPSGGPFLHERAMLHRVGSTSDGVSTVGIDRPSDFTPGAWLRQLRRHRVGSRILRQGGDRAAGVRSDVSGI